MNMFYGLYPVDTDVSDFTACAYNAEIILRLATKPEMGWYARNMRALQSPNRTIGFMGSTRRLITHQATSWTQQLYKDTTTRREAQKLHHPEPSTPLAANTVTDAMKVCPFCDDSTPNTQLHLHGDSIHLHIHCTNAQIQLTRDASNTDIAMALKHLGALFQHAPYDLLNPGDSFQTFMSGILHQYDDFNSHDTSNDDATPPPPFAQSTMSPRLHHSITSSETVWHSLRPTMTTESPELLTYTHGLVSSLPPANYTRATMNVIDHIYIGILPRSAHALIRQYFSLFVTNQQRAHDRRFPRSRTTPHIMSVYWDHAKDHPELLDALNCLRPAQDMKLYRLILKAWNKVSLALLQRARNVQTIIEALVYNRTRQGSKGRKKLRTPCAIPEPCGATLVQTLLHAHMKNPPTNPPTNTPILTATTNRIPCEHDRCNLYESHQLSRGFIIGRALFCPVCQIFNHAAKHAYHIERALRTRPRLRHSLAKLTYLPNQQSAITTTRLLLITLREHHAQDISSLLDNLHSQHAHLVTKCH